MYSFVYIQDLSLHSDILRIVKSWFCPHQVNFKRWNRDPKITFFKTLHGNISWKPKRTEVFLKIFKMKKVITRKLSSKWKKLLRENGCFFSNFDEVIKKRPFSCNNFLFWRFRQNKKKIAFEYALFPTTFL